MTFGYTYDRRCTACGAAFSVHDASSEAGEARCYTCRRVPVCGCCQLGKHHLCLARIWPVPTNCSCPCFAAEKASDRMRHLEPLLDPLSYAICDPCDIGIHEDCSHNGCDCDDNLHSREDDDGHVD